MRYELTPNTPRTIDQVKATFAPGDDARWRAVKRKTRKIDSIRAHEAQLKATRP